MRSAVAVALGGAGLILAALTFGPGTLPVPGIPRTEPVRALRGDPAGPLSAGGSPSPEPLAAIEVDGLRSYRVGTPASRIHWPALARGAGLLERRLQAEGGLAPLVVIDAR